VERYARSIIVANSILVPLPEAARRNAG